MARAVTRNVSLAAYTTLQVGGPARAFALVETEAELKAATAEAAAEGLPVRILGGGSNLLVADTGVEAFVMHMAIRGVIHEVAGDTVQLTAAAGERLDDVVAYAVAHDFWGLENLSHIPGTVGAIPVQNVGAYGVEVADLITQVRVLDTTTNTYLNLTPADCQFGYRDSIFKHEAGERYIVTAVTFALTTVPSPQLSYRDLAERFQGATPSLVDIRSAIIAIRAEKFPDWTTVGTAGSFFKNPIVPTTAFTALQAQYPEIPHYPASPGRIKVSLGWILDKVLHLKGYRAGTVGLYEAQALVLINHGGATSGEIAAFATDICARVYEVTGLTIEWEVRQW